MLGENWTQVLKASGPEREDAEKWLPATVDGVGRLPPPSHRISLYIAGK